MTSRLCFLQSSPLAATTKARERVESEINRAFSNKTRHWGQFWPTLCKEGRSLGTEQGLTWG